MPAIEGKRGTVLDICNRGQTMNRCCNRKRRGVTIEKTSISGCRWPVGRDERGHLFCDEPRLPGRRFAWCEEHYAMGTAGDGSRERERLYTIATSP